MNLYEFIGLMCCGLPLCLGLFSLFVILAVKLIKGDFDENK